MRAIEILKDNLDKLHEISDFLLKEETITGEQFMDILNKKPVENNNEISNEEIDHQNLSEEKNLDEGKENSSENSKEDLKKDLEETLKENEKEEEKSSNKDLDDPIALGSSEQPNQEDE